jgi:hypothetical protein
MSRISKMDVKISTEMKDARIIWVGVGSKVTLCKKVKVKLSL